MAAITTTVQIELLGRNNGWTDISADSLSPLRISYGIQGGGPKDRMASSGTLQMLLDNSAGNSGGLVGYYSPGNNNARIGWTLGIRVRVTLTDPATSIGTVKFLGSVTSILPAAGVYGPRRVLVEATDWIDEAARATTKGLTMSVM
jgi:hypothetical protein